MRKDPESLNLEFEKVQIPRELDLVIEKAIRRGRRSKLIGNCLKPLAAALAVMLVFVFGVNASPGFARYARSVPGLEGLVDWVSFDKGLVDVVDMGFGQVINKSATDNGVTMTVKNAIYDGRKLILLMGVESEISLGRIRWIDNEVLGFYNDFEGYIRNRYPETTGHSFDYLVEVELKGGQSRKDVLFKCYEIQYHNYDTQGVAGEMETIKGNWTILFQLEPELASCKPIHVSIDKEVRLGDTKFRVKSMEIYPTVIDVKIVRDDTTPAWITHFSNPRLVDENGIEYKCKASEQGDWESVRRGPEVTLSFESNYFINSRKLTLLMDGAYTIPKGGYSVVMDVANETVLDDGGLGVKFLRVEHDIPMNEFPTNEEVLYNHVIFTITDAKYKQAVPKFLSVDKVHDLFGKEYPLIYSHSSSAMPGAQDEFSLWFKAEEELPKAIRFKIIAISREKTEPIRVKLN
jgi:hypothetical protein